ncbi:AraC family transcriptional regulator [Paenibacillus sp. HJGM_3]|uniref:AraC family transcriptional regulator n=1 Tax=Paenibacillus sp. HJGM_3 TaxID=3379816 RepID=UPI00385B0A4D
MSVFPQYQDILTYNMFGKDDLPFYILLNKLSRKYPLHHHNFAELSFVIDGTAQEILNGRPHPLHRGTVSLLMPHHMHEILIEPGHTVTKYCCMFDLSILFSSPPDKWLGTRLLTAGKELPSFGQLTEQQSRHLTRIMEDLFMEYHSSNDGKNTMIRSKLLEALVFYIRTCQKSREPDILLLQDRKRDIFEVLKHMHLHYNEPLTLSSVSEQLDWNSSYLSHVFKSIVGKSFIEYLHELRIGRASCYLQTTNLSISEIALEVGFDNFRTFSRVYKELKGMTPSEGRLYLQ